MINEYKLSRQIEVNGDDSLVMKKLLSFSYQLWCHQEFRDEYLTIYPGYMSERGEHHIYTGMKEKEFVMYTFFIDTKKVMLKGKNVDAFIDFIDKRLDLVYYEKDKLTYVQKILDFTNTFHEGQFDKLKTATYFHIPNDKSAEFYTNLFNFICNLDCVDLKNGIMVTNRKGGFQRFYSNDTGLITPNKFYYSFDDMLIGFHKKTDMLVLCNIDKETFKIVKEYVQNFN